MQYECWTRNSFLGNSLHLSILFILFFSVITVKKRRCTTAAGTRRTAPSNVSRSTGTQITNVPVAGRDELATPLLSTPPIYKPRYWIDHGFLIFSQHFKPQLLKTLTWTFYWVAVDANRTSEHGISRIPRRDGFYVWILTVSLYISFFFFTLLFAVRRKSALLAYRLAEMWSTSNLFKQLNLKLCRYLNFYMSESCLPPALSEVGAFKLDGWFYQWLWCLFLGNRV